MSMSDKIVIMWQGVIAQEGEPAAIYSKPASSFVADFIGKSNILPILDIDSSSSCIQVTSAKDAPLLRAAAVPNSQTAHVCCIRPENVKVLRAGEDVPVHFNRLEGRLHRITNLGAYLELAVEIGPEFELSALVRSTRFPELPPLGGSLSVVVDPATVQLLTH